MERVAIFIDGSNLYHALKKEMARVNLDYAALAGKLSAGRKLIRTYYYNAPLDQAAAPQAYAKQRRFFAYLHSVPYLEIRLGRLVNRSGVLVEKGIDIKIAVDMLQLAVNDAYDTAVLVSGDGDFADAVAAVKNMGKHVENAFCKRALARHLQQACDRVIVLDEAFLQDCWVAPST